MSLHKTSAWAYMSPFGSFALKEERKKQEALEKLRLQEQQEQFVRDQQAAQAAAEAAAIEDLRRKTVSRIRELQNVALATTATISKIRDASGALPEGDSFLQNLEVQLSDMEAAVVAVQAGTVIDTASFDTHVLAVSYADAQGALIAIASVNSRAKGVWAELEAYLQGVARREHEEVQRQAQAERERQRLDVLRAREEADQERAQARAAVLQRIESMRILSEIETQIARERADLRQARYELQSMRSRRA